MAKKNNNEMKKVFFVAVTDRDGSLNKAYSNYVFALCKRGLFNDERIACKYDINEFKRHDMLPAGDLKESVFQCLLEYDAFIVLIDDYETYNPNVWFELGVLSTLDKPIVLIGKETTSIPFHAITVNVVQINPDIIDLFDDYKELLSTNSGIDIFVRKIQPQEAILREFYSNLVNQFLYADEHGSPFASTREKMCVNDLGYGSFTKLFNDSGIIDLIKNPDVHAEYIQGEKDAFEALTKAIKSAEKSVRTTRFANQSIVTSDNDEKPEISKAHDDFMQALYEASYKQTIKRFDRIVCNNNPSKWHDISEVMTNCSNKLKLYIRKSNYNINFELVVIDEKVAFIHFYQTNQSIDSEAGNNFSFENQRINSTLKISGRSTCKELAKIFDRLHHRDYDSNNPIDLSRTLLGIESTSALTSVEKKSGVFIPSKDIRKGMDAGLRAKINAHNRSLFIQALEEWDISDKDKVIMTIGLCLVFGMGIDEILINNISFNSDEKKLYNDLIKKYNLSERLKSFT